MTEALPFHPRTGLQAIGIVGGRPVWPICGGSEQTTEQPGAGQQQQAAAQTGQQQAAGQQAAGQQTGQQTQEDLAARDGEDAAALLARLGPDAVAKLALRYRGEAGDSRQTAKKNAAEQAQLELATKVAKALGLVDDDAGQVKPEQLQADLATQRAATRSAAVELQLYKTAAEHGGTPGDLLSMLVLRNADGLDPAAADFSAKVVTAAKAAIEANPMLRAVQAATVSGGQFGGGPVERDQSKIQPGYDRLQYAYGNPGR